MFGGAVIGIGLDGDKLTAIFVSFGDATVFVVPGAAEERDSLFEGLLSLEVVIDQIFDDFCFVFVFTFDLEAGISQQSLLVEVVFGVAERQRLLDFLEG